MKISQYPKTNSPSATDVTVIAFGGANYKVYLRDLKAISSYDVPLNACLDFMGSTNVNQLAPFDQGVFAGATALIASEANHPGIYRITSGAGANTGGAVFVSLNAFFVGGEFSEFVFRLPNTASAAALLGFFDNATTAIAPVDGAWINITGTTLTGKTSNNSVVSTSGSYTISANTWYHAKVIVNSNATQVDYYLYDSSGVLLWSASLTSNIPTTSARVFEAAACKAYWTAAAATNVLDLDFIGYGQGKVLVR